MDRDRPRNTWHNRELGERRHSHTSSDVRHGKRKYDEEDLREDEERMHHISGAAAKNFGYQEPSRRHGYARFSSDMGRPRHRDEEWRGRGCLASLAQKKLKQEELEPFSIPVQVREVGGAEQGSGSEDEEDVILEGESDDDSKIASIQEKSYQKWLPRLKAWVQQLFGDAKPKLLGDYDETICGICPSTQRFKGWIALLNHAAKFTKKKEHQHRGYHRALQEALRVHERESEQTHLIAGGRTVHPEQPDDSPIVWPPVIIIANTRVEEESHGSRTRDQGNQIPRQMRHHLKDLQYDRIVDVKGEKMDDRRCLLVFPASEVGYIQAKYLTDTLCSAKQGREDWMKWRRRHPVYMDAGASSSSLLFFGYLAEPDDMKILDPGAELVHWSAESKNEKVNMSSRQSRKETEQDRVKIEQELVAVDTLAESHKRYELEKESIAQLLVEKEREVESLNHRGYEMEAKFARVLVDMDQQFNQQLEQFKAESSEREEKMRQKMRENEERLQRAQLERFKKIEALRVEVEALQGEVKALEEQKQSEIYSKEMEQWKKNEEFKEQMQKLEAQLYAKAREEELELVNQHKTAEMELMKACEAEKEEVLNKWLEEQQNLKRNADESRERRKAQEKVPDMSGECAVCLEEFGEEFPRAYFADCGHAKVCMVCALQIFRKRTKTAKVCPICRHKLQAKPKRFDQIQWT